MVTTSSLTRYVATHAASGAEPTEQRLDAQKFTRVHRAHIVNLDHVFAFRPDDRGGLEAELVDGTLVPVSRARAQELRSAGRSAWRRRTASPSPEGVRHADQNGRMAARRGLVCPRRAAVIEA